MRRFLAHCLTTTLALGVSAWVLPGVRVISISALFVAALVLGFVNTIVKPLLFLLTLPITVLTLGFFYLVVNGLAFALAAWAVPGFEIRSFGWAIPNDRTLTRGHVPITTRVADAARYQ